ncbi:MAG: chorismate mutase [Paracoccus sp. (in: a-proteobacteria)]|nr:chorismate mutase [Paracoccus sp. (in: a-proteobacteria)]
MRPIDEIQDMPELRARIDALDAQLVALLAQRRDLIARAAQIKEGNGLPARITPRVEEVVDNVCRHALSHDLDVALIESIWRQLIEAAIAQEERYLNRGKAP